MSTQTLDLIPDIDFDIEYELHDGEIVHAITFCVEHHSPENMPIAGTIVQALCGRLFRFNRLDSSKPHCPECEVPMDSTCFHCGKEIYG